MKREKSALAEALEPESESVPQAPDKTKQRRERLAAEPRCAPFLKWAGGKSQLLPEILARFPRSFGRYFEPMIGGGALFFSQQSAIDARTRAGGSPAPRSYIADTAPELVNCYQVVRDDLPQLMAELERHRYDADYFYSIREADRDPERWQSWGRVERASRFIYLNKTCYNGLYRVNSKGEFNVPFGRYKNPRLYDAAHLSRCSALLQQAEIALASFESVVELVAEGDFVYFDPPYDPISETAHFTAYGKDGFSRDSQRKLRDVCRVIDDKGAYFLLSNSYTTYVLDLYREFRIKTVEATRAINSLADRRGSVREVLISNYPMR